MGGGVVLHHVLTRTIVKGGIIDMVQLSDDAGVAEARVTPWEAPRIAYLEEPFNNAISGGSSTSGYTDQCKRWGRLQGWLESWGYEVRGVQAKTWQRELLDLARFEVRTEKACDPKPLPGVVVQRINGGESYTARFKAGLGHTVQRLTRGLALDALAQSTGRPTSTSLKTVISHDTKAASIAYATEHHPEINLVPPRCRTPHDGLADAICIASWAGAQKENAP